MPTPTRSTSYPPAMLSILETAQALGGITIPSENPAALRLKFYGLLKALRSEKRPGLTEGLTFRILPGKTALRIEKVDLSPLNAELTSALASASTSPPPEENSPILADEAEAALERILNGVK